jgi:hypothetical protein
MAKKLVTFSASEEVRQALIEVAKKDNRSISQEIDLILKEVFIEKGLIKK